MVKQATPYLNDTHCRMLGVIFRHYRKHILKISIRRAADDIGVSTPTIVNLEAGRCTRLTLGNLFRYANYYGLKLSDLFKRVGL